MLEVVSSVPESKRASKSVHDTPLEQKRGSKTVSGAYSQEKLETPEEREKRLRAEKRAKEREEKHASAMAYVTKNKLDSTVQITVNKVLNHRPRDPYSALVKHLSEFSKDRPRFAFLRARPDGQGNIRLTLDVRIRGAVVQSHVAQLHSDIANKLQNRQPGEAGEETPVDQAAGFSACGKLMGAFGKVLENIEVTDFRGQQLALRNGAVALQESYGEEVLPSQGIVDELSGLLLDAEGRLMDLSAHRALKSFFLQLKYKVSPRMQVSQDFLNWEYSWPEICLPVFQGTKKGHRICLGMSLWAASLSDLRPNEEEGAESEFPTPEFVHTPAASANQDADEEDVVVPDYESCPPKNSVALVVQLGSALVAEATSGGTAFPGNDDFGAAAKKLQAAITAKLPKYAEMEQRLLKMQAAAEEEMDDAPEHTMEEKHQHKCVYGIVFPDANAAYTKETDRYDFFGDPENLMTSENLTDMYVQLFESNPFLTVLCRPFSTQDVDRFENLSKLRLRLPTDVVLIGDHGPLKPDKKGHVRLRKGITGSSSTGALNAEPEAQLNDTSETVGVGEDGLPTFREEAQSPDVRPESTESGGFDDVRTSWPDGSGFLRSCSNLHPLGIAAVYEQFSWAFSVKPGLYDMSDQQFPCVLPFVDVSLAMPENRRFFLLPQLDADGLKAALEPVNTRLRGIMEQMYRNGHIDGDEEMPKGITLAEFKLGLEKLGYHHMEEYGEAIFHFLDRGNNGTISENEISVMDYVDGPATLKEVDDLRSFLVDNLEKLAGPSMEEAHVDSPIKLLWQRMDRNGSGAASFSEFKRVLEKLKFQSDRKLQLFMCLDLKNNGVIDETEWSLMGVLSSNFKLERVDRVREFIVETFGSMPKAYKAMDKNKSGSLSIDEWMDVMANEYDYEDVDDVKACFEFLDKDCSNIISAKEFQFLNAFSRTDFMHEVRNFAEHLAGKYESVEMAYEDFECNGTRAKRQSNGPPGTGESRRSEFNSYLEPRDFAEGYKRSGYQGSYDPRLLFNFLDAARNCHVSKLEFRLLEKLDAVEKMDQSADFMTKAIASLKGWVFENYPGDADKDSWARTYAAIMEAARGSD
jgi:Ca2+-binding EF-hand superfamily protein